MVFHWGEGGFFIRVREDFYWGGLSLGRGEGGFLSA